jgi:ATP-dependent Clp protease adaptor protein ClpS
VERAGWDLAKDTGGLALLEKPQGDGDGAGARGGGGGPWRLLLLDAPSHTEGRVVAGLCQTVANVDEAHARNVFATSKQLGLALVVSCLREHAEHYRSQLYLRGLKTAIEPDNSA